MKLRDYQGDIFDQLMSSDTSDIVQLDTGAGKTPIEAALAARSDYALLVAHRNILITQLSEKLAAFGLEHDTISTEHTRRRCIASHRRHGRVYIRRGHTKRLVASMQSVVAALRHGRFTLDTSLPWLIVIDEGHHVIPDNMWGQLRELFPSARIIGFTATPARMDGESLHVDKGGIFERLVQAKSLTNDSTRALIDRGFLSGFKAYAACTAYSILDHMTLAEREAFSAEQSRSAYESGIHDSGRRRIFTEPKPGLDWGGGILELMGDPVAEYRRLALGRPAILMAPAIKNAELFARDFRAAGIASACISSAQSPSEIAMKLDAFRAGQIQVLTNVDMVGEGFDLPACEVLIIATRTASFPRFRQWCGRVLRPEAGKSEAMIIDLTGMIAQHGMPDEPVEWDLLNPPCGPKTKRHVPCDACGAFFLFKLENCPECGAHNRWLDESGVLMPGSYQFDIRLIDQKLRSYVLKERKQAQDSERLRTELLRPYFGFGGDLVGRALSAIAAWLPDQLLAAGVSISGINDFLQSQQSRDRNFYIKHFTRADITKDNPAKALKVYKAWLKQR